MVLKCCVTGCRSNYHSERENEGSISVFKLPIWNEEECDKWCHNIPRDNIPRTKYTAVCIKHWPEGFERIPYPGCKEGRPKYPPTIFPNILPCQTPTPVSLPRPTKRSLSSVRSVEPDEKKQHFEQMTVCHNEILTKIHTEIAPREVTSYLVGDIIHVQSNEWISGTCKFMLKIKPDLSYESFHHSVPVFIKTLSSKCMRVTHLTDWGHICEAIRYLDMLEPSHKITVLMDTVESMGKIERVGQKVYSSAMMIRSYEYLAISRACYRKFTEDFQLPSIATLTKLTSASTALSDFDFIDTLLSKLSDRQKQCIILVDEVYVKPALLYHGGYLFGEARNNPGALANSVLAVMVVSMFGGPSFLAKMIPVRKVNAAFQFSIVKDVISAIIKANGSVISVINDNNRVNQNFMTLFNTSPAEPWLTLPTVDIPGNIFLLCDFIHIFKCIRNNWITEVTKEIQFYHPADNSLQLLL